MDLMTLHRRTVEEWQRRLEGVRPDQWESPTPCADWDVRALVNHIVGEELWMPPLLEGQTIEQVGDRFDGDLLGDDAKATATRAAAAAVESVDQHLPKGGIVHLSFGDTPMEEYVRQLCADHLVHGWDLAAATSQDRTLQPELVAEVAGWYAEREEMYRSAGVVGARPSTTTGDQATDLLAGFGRSADWQP